MSDNGLTVESRRQHGMGFADRAQPVSHRSGDVPAGRRPTAQVALEMVDHYLQYCCERRTSPRVTELADRTGVDRIDLTRWFRRATGLQLAAYMRRAQIAIAEALLRNTSMTVEEIADRAAFGTVRSMYRAFRRENNISPGAYRASVSAKIG